MTVFEHIEKLKRDYTDKFVLVDDRCAELARFKGQTGRVKTVNMNGRALVEFDHYSNIGWFDIDVDYLKVIERPEPKEKKVVKAGSPAAKKTPAKTAPVEKDKKQAGGKKLSPLEMARMQDSGGAKSEASPTSSGAMSIAEKLAAARGGSGAAAAPTKAETASENPPVKDSGAMSIAEKLAAARGDAGSGAAVTDTEADTPAESDASADEIDPGGSAAAEAAEVQEVQEVQADTTVGDSVEAVDRSKMSVDDMVTWCREHDGQ
ncbi:MAG: hypothetical protein P8M53_05245 [Pirellulales bacterium]|nr:hypothetical protein [Pirellulales bacterium]